MMVNMSSTAVGSIATYQCRDGPTDVYTTQCTSTGVWDPSPNCTSKETGILKQHPMAMFIQTSV